MRVVFETKLTPAVTIYDSSAQGEAGGSFGKTAMSFLDPVVAVTDDDGTVLYQSGDFYESWFPYVAAGLGLVALYVIVRMVRS